jgi:hypothetical protein
VFGKSRLTDGRNGGDDLPKLQLIKNGRLTGSIETNHKNAHLLLGEEPLEQLGEREPHRSRKNPLPPPPPPPPPPLLLLLLILSSSALTRTRWLPICVPRLRRKHQILQRNSANTQENTQTCSARNACNIRTNTNEMAADLRPKAPTKAPNFQQKLRKTHKKTRKRAPQETRATANIGERRRGR